MLTAIQTDAEAAQPADDGALVLASRDGDHDAFRVLYERYAPSVLGFLVHRIGDHAHAEDALQETFTKAFRALDVFDEKRPFGPWIVAIAENVAFDLLRREGRAARVLPLADQPIVADAPDDLSVVTRREGEEVVRAALAALAPEPRRVLALRYERGLTQRQVADELGCSTRTVQTREAAALAHLARLLESRRTKSARKESSP